MASEQDETGGMASVKPDYHPGEESGTGDGFLPPLDLTIDITDFRHAKLSNIVAEHVLPQLVALHVPPSGNPPAMPLRTTEIAQLAQLLLGPDNADATNFVLKLKDEGVSLDDLHAELLEPAARLLGEL